MSGLDDFVLDDLRFTQTLDENFDRFILAYCWAVVDYDRPRLVKGYGAQVGRKVISMMITKRFEDGHSCVVTGLRVRGRGRLSPLSTD